METFRKINLNAAETMANFKIIPVAVLNSVDQGLRIAELLTKYGISAIEITFRTQVAAQAIAAVNAAFPGMFTGAGTILNCDDLRRAMDAGARFAVAPGKNKLHPICTGNCNAKRTRTGLRRRMFFP